MLIAFPWLASWIRLNNNRNLFRFSAPTQTHILQPTRLWTTYITIGQITHLFEEATVLPLLIRKACVTRLPALWKIVCSSLGKQRVWRPVLPFTRLWKPGLEPLTKFATVLSASTGSSRHNNHRFLSVYRILFYQVSLNVAWQTDLSCIFCRLIT